jgi:hypothetical protein
LAVDVFSGDPARFDDSKAFGSLFGIRLWIMLRDQIDHEKFCRRDQMRQNSGRARSGMPEVGHSPAVQ